jgi:hypothetical protein
MGNCSKCGQPGHYAPKCTQNTRKRRALEGGSSSSTRRGSSSGEVIELEDDASSQAVIHAAGQHLRAVDVPGTSQDGAPISDPKNMSIEEYTAHLQEVTSFMDAEITCCVCMGPLISPLFASCEKKGHVTCATCHHKLRETTRTCPTVAPPFRGRRRVSHHWRKWFIRFGEINCHVWNA